MKETHCAIAASLVAFGFFLIAVAFPAEAGTKVLKSKLSGSFVSTNFDFNHSHLSTPATTSNGAGTGTAGKFTFQGVFEAAPDARTCTVSGGVAGAGTKFTLVGDVVVVRFSDSGDQMFLKGTSLTPCVDFSTSSTPPFPFSYTAAGIVTGETGAFSGATGTFTTSKGTGAFLSFDARGTRGFGWFKEKDVTILTVP